MPASIIRATFAPSSRPARAAPSRRASANSPDGDGAARGHRRRARTRERRARIADLLPRLRAAAALDAGRAVAVVLRWPLRAVQSIAGDRRRARPHAPRRVMAPADPSPPRVVVLGAGACGLGAARE